MSGLVAVLARDPGVLATGSSSLDLLCHTPEMERACLGGPGAWLGACGRRHEISVAEAGGGEGGDGSAVAAVAAGEIANCAAVARELGCAHSASSAELALAAYRRWGAALFERLDGIFAIVIVDRARGATLAGADPYGVMYLHLTRLGDDILIATEAKAFLVDPRFHVAADDVSVSCVVALGHEFGRGLFAGVEACPQGSHFEIDGATVRTVCHWDAREAVGALTGRAYVARLRETIGELADEAFAGGTSLLPLTGGLDSRLLAAARPPGAAIDAVTFGCASDSDCRRARQIAARCGMRHDLVAFEPGYLAAHALDTTWLTEGRLTPAENTTGFQMRRFADRDQFVSGVCCGIGRRFSKAKSFFPDWGLTGPDNPALDAWMMLRFSRSGMSPEEASTAFGSRADQAREPGIDALTDYLARTRGMCGVDRLDLYFAGGRARGWRCSGLDLAGIWITPRAPFFSRRWVEAVLAGAPSERLDDLPRLRLIRDLDPAVARVPWVMTLAPLGPSSLLLRTLKQSSKLRRGGREPGASDAAPSASRIAATRRYMGAVKGVYHRVYSYGDHRDEWLRTASRGYVEGILRSDRLGDHGFTDPGGVRRLLDEHMAGSDHTLALSILLGIELWHRLFVDGEWTTAAGAAALSAPAASPA